MQDQREMQNGYLHGITGNKLTGEEGHWLLALTASAHVCRHIKGFAHEKQSSLQNNT